MHPAMSHHGNKIPHHGNKLMLLYFPPSEAQGIHVEEQNQANYKEYSSHYWNKDGHVKNCI